MSQETVIMDNDLLIDQARKLYAGLLVKQLIAMTNNAALFERFERLIFCAYCRYLRRLNRCTVCYQHRNHDCVRVVGEKLIPCQSQHPH